MIRFLICAVSLIFMSSSALSDNLEKQFENWVEGKQSHCFEPKSPYLYCLLDIPNEKFSIVDINGDEMYQIYYFDNWPDAAKDGVYRIIKNNKIGYADAITGKIVIEAQYDCAHPFENSKAHVGIGCKIETDGEHSWWVGGNWQWISLKGEVINE